MSSGCPEGSQLIGEHYLQELPFNIFEDMLDNATQFGVANPGKSEKLSKQVFDQSDSIEEDVKEMPEVPDALPPVDGLEKSVEEVPLKEPLRSAGGAKSRGPKAHAYSRDFLLGLRGYCTLKPEGLEVGIAPRRSTVPPQCLSLPLAWDFHRRNPGGSSWGPVPRPVPSPLPSPSVCLIVPPSPP